jgi:hypothetical protein
MSETSVEPVTGPSLELDTALHLSTRTVAWLADHPTPVSSFARSGTSSPSWNDPVSTPAPSTHCGGS